MATARPSCPLQALRALPGPTSRWARAWSRSHRTGPLRASCAPPPSHPPPEPLQQPHRGPALPLPSPAGGCSWRSGAACSPLVQARGRGMALGQWPPPLPCWGWLEVWVDGTGRKCGSGAGWVHCGCPSGMRASSGCVGRGHSQSSRDTPEWRLPREGAKERGKGVRVGAAGADCPCLHAAPQSRPPSQSRVRLQLQCGPKMRVPLMGRPGAPWIWLLWRLHLIPFAEQTDPNVQSLQGRGGWEPKEGRWRETERERGTVWRAQRGADRGDEWECERDVNEKIMLRERSCLTNSNKKFRWWRWEGWSDGDGRTERWP